MNNKNVAKVIKLAISLALVCVVAGGGLALTYAATEKQIEIQAQKQVMESNMAALPLIKSSEGFKEKSDLASEAQKKHEAVITIFEGTQNGKAVGWVVQVGPRGYGGPLVFAVGIDSQQQVKGVSIIDNKETPGLGQKIEEPGFRKQFQGKSGDDPLEVGKDVDAITGATISSKAVIEGVKQALETTEIVGVE